MNWEKFITHNQAYEKAFETLCNQLFENWCKKEYVKDIEMFRVVNGSGGDGGIESYAILNSGEYIGMQAKWFLNSLGTSQINQIRKSILTALKVRPNISRYIVCLPRNLSSKKANADNTEDKRWDEMITSIKKEYPVINVELWNSQRLLQELQKTESMGIYKYWFENSEIFYSSICNSFEKSKRSWLDTKYVPELDVAGKINKIINIFAGDKKNRKDIVRKLNQVDTIYRQLLGNLNELVYVLKDECQGLREDISKTEEQIKLVLKQNEKIMSWIENEQVFVIDFDESLYYINFYSLKEKLNEYKKKYNLYNHFYDVINDFDELYEYDFESLIDNIKVINDRKAIVFLGDPGTGKTHGVSSVVEQMLENKFHIPILIEAKSISKDMTWRDILISSLRMSTEWDETELWQALSSLSNAHRIDSKKESDDVEILPKILIIVDAIDESRDYEKWIDRIKETEQIIKNNPLVRFVFTSRPFVFDERKDLSNQKYIRLKKDGDAPVYKLYDKYIKQFNVRVINNNFVKYSLTTPFSLKLFCELNKNKTVFTSDKSDITVDNLVKEKIKKIESEYSRKNGVAKENKYIFKTIKLLSDNFLESNEIEWSELISTISSELNIDKKDSEKMVVFLKKYGIISVKCEKATKFLDEDKIYCVPGIQGYLDYVCAETIIVKYESPEKINFLECKGVNINCLYVLASLSMQRFDYLLTKNATLTSIVAEHQVANLQFFALRHTNLSNSSCFVKKSKEIMATNSDGLFTIVNELVLPLSRYKNHPLGIPLLDEFLLSFEKPAQRDLVWSLFGYVKAKKGDKWYRIRDLELENEEYLLNDADEYDGLPVFYAWLLSGLNNTIREKNRNKLFKWSILRPNEFVKLFYKFSSVNDPQIVEEMYSILMCCIYETADSQLVKEISQWIINNALALDEIEKNRNIAIRYYCIAILEKAHTMGIIGKEDLKKYLPPYNFKGGNISLNLDATEGTRMAGYKAIHYDLSRYVLIDHLDSYFSKYGKKNHELEELLMSISIANPMYKDLTFDKFVISVVYQYILDMGWNEEEFRKYDYEKKIGGGFDIAVGSTYYPATHGSKSKVMTVCEKYVWQARNMLNGYLTDRLCVYIDDEWKKIENYEMLDNFYIPSQDLELIDPHNIPLDYDFYIPEREKIMIQNEMNSKEDIVDAIRNASEINEEKWIFIDNSKKMFKINEDSLLVLNGYLNHIDKGIDTNISLNSIIIECGKLNEFINCLQYNSENKCNYLCPDDWKGNIETSCYITPKEVCWFSWIKRDDAYNIKVLKDISAMAVVDECVHSNDSYGDVYYYMPSPYIRKLLNITNTNGYVYTNTNEEKLAQFYIAGKLHKNYQQLLLTKPNLLSKLKEENKMLIWLVREFRQETMKIRERYGDFYCKRYDDYILYIDDNGQIKKVKINQKLECAE